jgi:hypothetical protein
MAVLKLENLGVLNFVPTAFINSKTVKRWSPTQKTAAYLTAQRAPRFAIVEQSVFPKETPCKSQPPGWVTICFEKPFAQNAESTTGQTGKPTSASTAKTNIKQLDSLPNRIT